MSQLVDHFVSIIQHVSNTYWMISSRSISFQFFDFLNRLIHETMALVGGGRNWSDNYTQPPRRLLEPTKTWRAWETSFSLIQSSASHDSINLALSFRQVFLRWLSHPTVLKRLEYWFENDADWRRYRRLCDLHVSSIHVLPCLPRLVGLYGFQKEVSVHNPIT